MIHVPNADGLNKMIDQQIGDFVTTQTDNASPEEEKASIVTPTISATDLSVQEMAMLHMNNEITQIKEVLRGLLQSMTVELKKLK